jgi:hypothetical protein
VEDAALAAGLLLLGTGYMLISYVTDPIGSGFVNSPFWLVGFLALPAVALVGGILFGRSGAFVGWLVAPHVAAVVLQGTTW